MITCPACGEENPDRARFCLACATALEGPPASAGEERKVVSVLFVDLVGFTGRSEQADPEDVRALLQPYHSRVKQEIERFGGTVEKFVGDAVMAVFGAPVGHEDDPERAVRAGLRILEAMEELALTVRAAVNTGEAVVALGARPEQGEGIVAGDVVNTASRLQSVAPVGGIVVGEPTYRATREIFEYEALEPVTLKGKSEPVPLWQAKSARMRFGVDVDTGPTTPFVGRDDDLAVLRSTYSRTLRDSSIQLVTVTGEPGVGKTRLLAEFRAWVDDQPEIVYWRQGRSLPYGEGVTYWALGEMLKAHAGILESDGLEEATDKLAIILREEEEPERGWLQARLLPLIGAGESSAVEREESFAAWRRFLEGIATKRPLVLIFEDLHWADDALVAFIEHLVDWSSGVPLLVLCTARPELYERHSGWGGGKRNSTTIAMSPLTGEETARLLAALLERAVLPVETQTALLERCGGNPLYAEEFTRMVRDRDLLTKPGAEIPVPETVQALIAARLDTLSPERKALLHDAAVVGKVFWAGALTAMGGVDPPEVRDGLHDLARKELVRPARASSVKGEEEYAFWHLLVRDVAYGQIPRGARARKHEAAAMWIEQMGGERLPDHAELLAHHYSEAVRLAQAAGDDNVEALRSSALRFLIMAGERTLRLDRAVAEGFFRQALELAGSDGRARAPILVRLGEAEILAARLTNAEEYLEEAEALFRAAGNRLGEAEATLQRGRALWSRGDRVIWPSIWERVRPVLEREPPSRIHAFAYSAKAAYHMHFEQPSECIEWADRALAVSAKVDEKRWALDSLQYRGFGRCLLGDLGGREDLREAVRRAQVLGSTAVAYVNLGDIEWWIEGPARALELYGQAAAIEESRGLPGHANWAHAQELWVLYDLGRWDEVVQSAATLTAWSRDQGGTQIEGASAPYEALVLARRGDTNRAAEKVEEFMPRIRGVTEPQIFVPALFIAALVELGRGDQSAAAELMRELAEETRDRPVARSLHLPAAVRICISLGEIELAEELLSGAGEALPRQRFSVLGARAILAEAHAETESALELYEDAAARWAEYGFVLERAESLFGVGRCLYALGRDGGDRVREARDIFVSLGARPLMAETDALMGTQPAAAGEA